MSYEKALELIKEEKVKKTGKLELSYLGLQTIPTKLLDLEYLIDLDLSSNQISDASLLESATNLKKLTLNNNNLSDCSFLKGHQEIRELNLGSNQISDASLLESATNLKKLILNNNNLSDCSFLEGHQEIRELNLSSNQISDASMLESTTKLKILGLSYNSLEDCSFLKNHEEIRELDLSSNQIFDTSFLSKLVNLETLNLFNNQISNIYYLKELINLRFLDLRRNQISELSSLQKLTKLEALHLNSNRISNVRFLENLVNLQSLDLRNNQISDVSSLGKLAELQFINLNENNISKIDSLEKLTKLRGISLSKNNISDISPLLAHIKERKLQVLLRTAPGIGKITLYGNAISTPPLETISRGTKDILNFFADVVSQGKAKLYEAKLLIVGDGRAGKTSLARKIEDLDHAMPGKEEEEEEEDRTKGIDIKALPIHNIKESGIPFLMNVWDFGGQGYYHSTHQFFLTKRSLYVLLNNTRINKTDFNGWLQTISLFSDNSPIIIVENEVNGAKSDLDLRGLQQHFDNILYVREADISNTMDGRLEKLVQDIQIEIQRLPHIGSELPKQWVDIREILNTISKTRPYISDQEFYKICRQNNVIQKESIQRLGDLFHDLGIFLHFREDKVLKRIVIMQNDWATKGVYTILDDKSVRDNKGYFTIKQAEKIWDDTPFEELHDELISLMEKFRLCYRVPYSTPVAYISPNLLPVEKPDYIWDQSKNLIINYDYDFMPRGLLGMLIVELHRYVKDIKHRAWRTGCIFHHQGTDAQVIETYGKRALEIRIRGAHTVHLSSIIISEIDKLNTSFKRIKVKKKIPCPCKICINATKPHFFDYDILMKRKTLNKLKAECLVSFEDINVLEVLEAAYNEKYTKTPDLKQLIKDGEIKKAIDLFEENFPNEGTILLSRYNQLQRYRYLGTITTEEWNVNKNQITESLLELSKLGLKEHYKSNNSKETKWQLQLGQTLDNIKSKLKGQDFLLNEIINRNDAHQHELLELLSTIENKEKEISEEFALEIIAIIERGMADFTKKVPDAISIIADWQKASHQLKLAGDSKVKLKWTIPFLFMKIEKEVAWEGKDWFRAIKEDIQRGQKGNWSEMFVTD